jgi:Ulp1 family protease
MAMQIFLPLNRGLHWYAAVIIPEERDIQILNSIPSMEPGDELQHTVRLHSIIRIIIVFCYINN